MTVYVILFLWVAKQGTDRDFRPRTAVARKPRHCLFRPHDDCEGRGPVYTWYFYFYLNTLDISFLYKSK